MSSIEDEKNTARVDIAAVGSGLKSIVSPSGKIIEIAQDDAHLDAAIEFARDHGQIEVSQKEDTRFRVKVDLIVMPLFCFLYMVQYMDKTCITFAAIMGIQKKYHMVGEMYSWTNSGFYLGYLFGCPFSAILLQKVPTIKFVSGVIVIWGTVQCLHCVAQNYASFMFLRTFLGFLEAFVSPIFVIILNQYYRHSEHFGRTGWFYGFNGTGTIFMSSVAYGLYRHQGSYSLVGYKILFLIVGLLTILCGLLIFFIMPNFPTDATWLSEREKEVVVARIRDNNQGFGNKKFKWDQAKEVLVDPRTYIYFLLSLSVAIPNGGVAGFSAIIIKSFGYATDKALLMKMPVGGVELFALASLPFLSRFIKSRMTLAIGYMCIVLAGVSMLAFSKNNAAALAGMYIFGMSPVGIILITSCVSSNTAGHTKKMITNAITLAGYAAGNVIGPQTFKSSDAPHYSKAKAGAVGCYCASIFLMAILTAYNMYINKKRDREREEMGAAYVVPENLAFSDLTDFQNPEFRYRI
ncbi:hypothetical protein DAMA08_015720 [Martiniozyma asiatica (nom. inval.)]|nr:hypothetical protein DAMA08_015720 [Martiniozyma asiatica]